MNKMIKPGFVLLLSILTASCGGGGGSGASSSTTTPSTTLPFPLNVVVANAKFLLFPNPQQSNFNTVAETNTTAYATAYYTAIDPANERTTLAGFKAKNGFGSGTGSERLVIFGDQHDLGYGRKMTAREYTDGTGQHLAFYVDNYVADLSGSDYGTYSHLNVEAAVLNTRTNHFAGTSAIEFSPAPGGSTNIVKFYNFDENGNRRLLVNQDGLGYKAMPNICVSCHGGRGDPLTPTGLFALVGNSVSQARGDTESHLQALKVHTFDFSTASATYSRANQEASIRDINQWIHNSYASTDLTAANEWKGSIAQNFIETAYGQPGVAALVGNYNDIAAQNFLPDVSWQSSGLATVYQNVLAPACMTCHILRGTRNSSDISFTTATQFTDYTDRISAHVFDRGNMPLAKIVFDKFWATGSTLPDTLATSLSLATGVKPGRPIADPGPDRVVLPSATIPLSASNSLYSSSYTWALITNPGGASLTSSSGATTSLNATTNGTYVIRLTATGNGLTGTADLTVKVDNTLAYDPTNLHFSDIKNVLQSNVSTCKSCHNPVLPVGHTFADTGIKPPIFYNATTGAPADIDRNGDTLVNSTDDDWFYKEVRGRVNFTDVPASAILRKPSGHHHAGGQLPGFDTTAALGDSVNRGSYDMFVNWILLGAPQ